MIIVRLVPGMFFLHWFLSFSGVIRGIQIHGTVCMCYCCVMLQNGRPLLYLVSVLFFFSLFYFPAPGQAVVTDVVPSPPRFLPSVFIAHRVQQSHCLSPFHRVLLTHAFTLSASQLSKKKSLRIYTSMHSGGLELTKITYYTRLEDNLIHHRGDRL